MRYRLYVIRHTLHATRYRLYIIRYTLYAICHTLYVIRVYIYRYMLCVFTLDAVCFCGILVRVPLVRAQGARADGCTFLVKVKIKIKG